MENFLNSSSHLSKLVQKLLDEQRTLDVNLKKEKEETSWLEKKKAELDEGVSIISLL